MKMLRVAVERSCERCHATNNLRLKDSVTVWHEGQRCPQQVNTYLCIDRLGCSERVDEASQVLGDEQLWQNYRLEARKRRYTPRRYWQDGRRLTFTIAVGLFDQAGLVLEKGQSTFPLGLKSGYIINRYLRFTSLLEAVKLIYLI